ncbi:Polyisoprenoid-binding protein YceI [Amycolatopsis xylanica]|uniref:Polyisoprenoid-binding protein YceI n=1 Tax=Amycolatopsis xylanica TaxID=589385 RepID=A0A1H3EDF3_9PSEU|nr:YceI family protein [Amycolatopsis xylanica]SDX76650.1 Polyisoprenoid-binding protein YceI [Amycolatopsis xylanica]
MTAATLPQVGTYQLVPSLSSITFAIKKLGIFTIHGGFEVRSGRGVVGEEGVTVFAEIDAASFVTGNKHRDKQVRGRSFLDSARHPKIIFEGTVTGDMVSGVLSFRDSAEIELIVDEVRTKGPRVDVRAHGQVSRSALGVPNGRPVIGDLLEVGLTVSWTRD